MISTPNSPGGLFDTMEREPEDTCMYKHIHLGYTCGLRKIYTSDEIEKAKASPSFEREYNLKYGYGIGNLMTEYKINRVFVDGTNRAVWAILKNTIGESIHDDHQIYESDTIVPLSFGVEQKKMLSDLQMLFSNNMVAVPPQFDDLILDLRIARTSAEGKVEKTPTAQLDLFDSLRLCTKHYRFE